MGCYNWFDRTDMIYLFWQSLTFQLEVNSCSDMSSWKKILFMVCYSLLDSKVIGKRYLKFPIDIRKFPNKLRIGKEKNWQNSIYTRLSGRLTGSF